MIYCKTIEVSGLKGALHGMRAPMQSYNKSDTKEWDLGENDIDLSSRLIAGGSEHRKFLRMIHVQAQFAMPRYWWSEYDTYKIGTVANSESTMHRLLNNNNHISADQFYFGKDKCVSDLVEQSIADTLIRLEILRKAYKGIVYTESEDIHYWHFIQDIKNLSKVELLTLAKRILPECFIQVRTVDLNYETIRTIYHQRKAHRLKEEWIEVFCSWVESLPFADIFILN